MPEFADDESTDGRRGSGVSESPARPTTAGLADFNALPAVQARNDLLDCAASTRWAELVAGGRPYRSLDGLMSASELAFDALTRENWLETFAGHARIGQPGDGDARGASEQAGAGSATDTQRVALARGNEAYEARFGHVFLICASGLDAGQMLGALHGRIDNPPELEFALATGEQRKIAALRLRAMLSA